MDVEVEVKRTWQQEDFEPISIGIKIFEYDVDDYENTFKEMYSKAEKSLIESEIKLRDMYTEVPKDPKNDEWDKPVVDTRRKPKLRNPRKRRT